MTDAGRRRLVEWLLTQAERLARVGSWAWDVRSGAVVCTPELYRIYGRDAASFTPSADALLACVLPADREPVKAALERAWREGRGFELEFRVVRPDGGTRAVHARGDGVRDETGAVRHVIVTVQDVTERKQLEALRLRTAADHASRAATEAASRVRSEFLATMNHELRTPLNAIGGYVELLELGIRGPVSEAQRDDLRRIRRNQQHLLALVNDVLNLARIGAGALRLERQRVSVREVVGGLGGLVEPQLRAKQLAFQCTPGDADAFVQADPDKLEQVLLNLLSNAVKFTPPGGQVRVEWSAVADAVAIRVCDTGRGIPAHRLEAVFEPFVQADRWGGSSEGAGLGLAISRELARAMGGDITVASRVGEGSIFTLTLPRFAAAD